jgi:muconate cycloisomerase
MRITGVRVTPVVATRVYPTATSGARVEDGRVIGHDRSDFALIELLTDAGLIGLGEVSDLETTMQLPDGQALTAPAIQAYLERTLIGADPLEVEATMARLPRVRRGGPEPRSVLAAAGLLGAAVDGALFDLLGKVADQPATAFLGGRVRDRVWVSWVAYIRDPESLAGEIEEKVRQGFTAFKLKVGIDIDMDEARLRVMREIAGPDADIKLDPNAAWAVDEAVANIRRLEKYRPSGIESPVAYDDVEGKAAVRRRVGTPILEHVSDPAFALALVRGEAIDVFNVSTVSSGGIWAAKKVIAVAEAAGLPCLLGSTVELGVGTAAQIALAASSPAVAWPSDLIGPLLYTADVIAEPWRWQDGHLLLPDGPGLGVSLDPARVAALAS